jgi:hypothetical protein
VEVVEVILGLVLQEAAVVQETEQVFLEIQQFLRLMLLVEIRIPVQEEEELVIMLLEELEVKAL